MNYAEMGQVLAKAAVFDFRTVSEFDVMAWHEACGDLDAADAMAAVTRWYRDRSDRLMPSHLREAVALVQADRRRAERLADEQERAVAGAQAAPPRRLAEMPPEVQEAIRSAGRTPLGRSLLEVVRGERFGVVYGEPTQREEGAGEARAE
jgi:hypothetical protein